MLEKYLKKGMRLALAVSGGKDSMVMLDKILRLKERFNLDVRVVNVNHKIRTADSLRITAKKGASSARCTRLTCLNTPPKKS